MKTMIDRHEMSGTNAERLLLVPGNDFIDFYETDTNSTYLWHGTEWEKTKTNEATHIEAMSVNTTAGGANKKFTINGTSAQSQAITSSFALVTPSVDCYFREAANPTAVAPVTDGALGDNLLIAGNQYRIAGITSGNKLAFITTGATGTVEVCPGG